MRVDPSRVWAQAPHAPRAWQREVVPIALAAVSEGRHGIVRAVMGAGKSIAIAEVPAACDLCPEEVVVLSTPTVALVDQLAATVEARVGLLRVGRYYTHAKVIRPITVTCNPSLPCLLDALGAAGLRPALWVLDEAHNSEAATLRAVAERLPDVPRLGFTATPYRASKKERLSLFDELLYTYGVREALRDGVIVPWELRLWEGDAGVPVDDVCVAMLRQALAERIAPLIVDAGGWSAELEATMSGCADAEAFAARLCAEGMRASFVHSGITRAEVAERLEQLRSGALQVLVHVALLKEGVDLPWLRGICLRRRVLSSTWFAQHVGRALRACGGKTHAVVMDPHDLFGLHNLNAEALLSGGEMERRSPLQLCLLTLQELSEISEDRLNGERRGTVGELRLPGHGVAKAMPLLERELRRVRMALEACGVLKPSEFAAGAWRKRPASPKQLETVRAKAARLARATGTPKEVRALLRVLFANSDQLSRGAASDFLDIVFDLPRTAWPVEASTLLEVA